MSAEIEIPIRVDLTTAESQQQFALGANENAEPHSVASSEAINVTVNTDYEALSNKPSINGVTLVGNKTSAELGIDQTFTFTQNTAADVWEIEHNLNRYPSVTVVDSAGSVVVGDVQYLDSNNIRCYFRGAFSGTAYLN